MKAMPGILLVVSAGFFAPRGSAEIAHGKMDPSTAPSFNCPARANALRMICGNSRLSALDREMIRMYAADLVEFSGGPVRRRIIRDQRLFLDRRNACRTNLCLERLYLDRIHFLESYEGDAAD